MSGILGYGTTFFIHNGTTLTPVTDVTNISPPSPTKDVVDITTYASPGRTRERIAGLVDPGEMTLEMNYIAGSGSDTLITSTLYAATTKAMKIVIPTLTGTWEFTFQGFVTNYTKSAPVDGKQSATVTIMIAGAITEAAGA